MKHAPGPWTLVGKAVRAKNFDRYPEDNSKMDKYGPAIAVIPHFGSPATQQTIQASARLIVSAPDMLAALDQVHFELLTWLEGKPKKIDIQEVIDLIAAVKYKARGE